MTDQNVARKKVLFVCYGGGHATMVAPVVKALNASWPDIETVVLGLTTARNTLEQAGIPFLGFRDFYDPESDADVLEYGRMLQGDNHATHTNIPCEESLAYLGLNYRDLVAEHGEHGAKDRYEREKRQCFMPMGTMKKVFDRENPDFVVTTTSPRSELAARRLARARALPTMAMTDVLSRGKYVAEMHVDHLTVASKTADQIFSRSANVSAGQIHLVGNPAMDRLAKHLGKPRDIAWRERTFPVADPSAKLVLLAEQYGYLHRSEDYFVPFSEADIWNNLERMHAACRQNNAIVLVRPHPSLIRDMYQNWVAGKGDTAFMAADQDLTLLLNACDLVVSNFSTIMVDALYLDRPVLLTNYPESGNLMPFDEMGFAAGVMIEDPGDLADGMRRALTDRDMHAGQQQAFHCDFPELPCAPKIADIIGRALS